MKEDKLIKLEGQIIEALANAKFKVEVEHEQKKIVLLCYPSGKIRQNKISLLVGDKIDIVIPQGIKIENTIGRITYRRK